ncbi:hypothetical protein P8452_44334 [Trifolium repens]|nr:hypothetical protein P8452_44334 [Trifolium repens]
MWRLKPWKAIRESYHGHFRKCGLLILCVKHAKVNDFLTHAFVFDFGSIGFIGLSTHHHCLKVFHGQPMHTNVPAAPHPPAMPERLRRERIAERIRALQDLVPSVNKVM